MICNPRTSSQVEQRLEPAKRAAHNVHKRLQACLQGQSGAEMDKRVVSGGPSEEGPGQDISVQWDSEIRAGFSLLVSLRHQWGGGCSVPRPFRPLTHEVLFLPLPFLTPPPQRLSSAPKPGP